MLVQLQLQKSEGERGVKEDSGRLNFFENNFIILRNRKKKIVQMILTTLNLGCVLAHPTIIEYHRLGVLNDEKLFLIVLEGGESKIQAPADPVSG